MPELSRFLGIVIGMFYREHGVPHFHAVYGGHEISVEVETGRIHGQRPVFPTRTRGVKSAQRSGADACGDTATDRRPERVQRTL